MMDMKKGNGGNRVKDEVSPEFKRDAEKIYEKHKKIFDELAKH